MKANPDQVFSLAARFATKVHSLGLESERVQSALDNGNDPLWRAVTASLVTPKQEVPEITVPRTRVEVLLDSPEPCAERSFYQQLSAQSRLYKKLGWTFTEFDLLIPSRQEGFDRLLVMVDPTLTNNKIYDVLEASFPCWRYVKNLDKEIPENRDERHPCRGPYAIWVRDCIEADEVHKDKSVKMIKEEGLKTLTLLERMYLEALVYHETGKHLDQESMTLCSGSRDSDNNVPYVSWSFRFKINRTSTTNETVNPWTRQAVTL